MTPLGEYLNRKSVTKAAIARKTGLTVQRLNDLCLKTNARPMGFELYLIALAIDADIVELFKTLYKDLHLKEV